MENFSADSTDHSEAVANALGFGDETEEQAPVEESQPEEAVTPGEEDGATDQPQAETEEEAPKAEAEEEQKEGEDPESEPFTKLDPNSLDPALKPYYNSMHKDYLEKTRNIAVITNAIKENEELLRNIYDEAQTPQEMAAMAVEQIKDLYTDGDKLLQFYQEAGQVLQANGYLEGQESEQLNATQTETEVDDDDEVAQLRKQVEQQQQYLAQQEQAQKEAQERAEEQAQYEAFEQQFYADLDTVQKSPEFADFDNDAWELTAKYALSNEDGNVDVLQAAQKVRGLIDNAKAKYLKQKADQPNIPAGSGTPASVSTEPPKTVEEAGALAEEKVIGWLSGD